MEFTPFRMAIMAVVTIILIYLALTLFVFPESDFIKEMNKGLTYSQENLGKSYSKQVFYPKGLGVTAKESFDTPQRVVSFQCNKASICFGEFISVEERGIFINGQFTATTSFRCIYSGNLYVCRIYIGERPAQMIFKVIDLNVEKDELRLSIENTGNIDASDAKTTIKIYKKDLIAGSWVKTLYSEPITKEINSLKKGEEKQVLFELGITENGLYVVEFKTEAVDAGFDQNSVEFEVTGREVVETCIAKEKGETSLVEGKCRTKYLCEGCNHSFECKMLWQEKEPSKSALFEIADKSYVIIEFDPDPESGLCTPP